MKNISLFLFNLLVIGFLSFSSCNNKTSNRHIEKVDSVMVVLGNLEAAMNKIDTSKINRYYNESLSNLVLIQKNFKDTMSRDTAIFLADYQATKKSFLRLIEVIHDQSYEINYSKKQLKNLKTDLENGLVSEQQFDDYFVTEIQAIETLSDAVSNTIVWQENAVKSFEERNPKVQILIQKIQP